MGRGSYAWVKQCLDQLNLRPGDGLSKSIDPDIAELVRLAQPLVDRLHGRARKDLDEKITQHEKELATAQEDADKARSEVARLNQLLKLERERTASAEAALGKTEETAAKAIEKLERQLTNTSSAIKEEQTKHEATREKLALAYEDISGLKTELAVAKAESVAANEKLVHFRDNAAKVMGDIRATQASEVKLLNRRLRELEHEIAAKNRSIEQLNRDNGALVTQNAGLQEQLRNQEKNLKAMRSEIDATTAGLNAARKESTGLQAKLELRENDLHELKKQLQANPKDSGS